MMNVYMRGGFVCNVVVIVCVTVVKACTEGRSRPPENAHLLYVQTNEFVLYECDEGYTAAPNRPMIQWCEPRSRYWHGFPGRCVLLKGCESNPCKNGGWCDDSEDPHGWGYYCKCPRSTGGRTCQIKEPCAARPCPRNTRRCVSSSTSDRGRYCYDRRWNLLD